MQTPMLSLTRGYPPTISTPSYGKGPHNQSKKSNDGSKNLHNQDLDKQTWIRSIRQRSTAPYNADTHPTRQITQSNSQASPKQGISSKVVALRVEIRASDIGQFGGKDDGTDDSKDGYQFAKDD